MSALCPHKPMILALCARLQSSTDARLWGSDAKSFGREEVRRGVIWVMFLGCEWRGWPTALTPNCRAKQANNVKHVVLSLSRVATSSKFGCSFQFLGRNRDASEQIFFRIYKHLGEKSKRPHESPNPHMNTKIKWKKDSPQGNSVVKVTVHRNGS